LRRFINMGNKFLFYVGIDWATQSHQVCLMDQDGNTIEQRKIEHSGTGIAQLTHWLEAVCQDPASVAVAIEIPRGAVVESLIERQFAVFSINPKQLDRFRDRHSAAGAKDDGRDAFVLADSMRTDPSSFHRVRIDGPLIIRLRGLSRLDDDLDREITRLTNQLREQLHRYYPQVLKLSSAANEPWLWDLLEVAPTPPQAQQLTEAQAEMVLRSHHIRRLRASDVITHLNTPALRLAAGAVEAASEHVLLLLPRLRLAHQQRLEVGRRIEMVLDELSVPTENGEQLKHRDVQLLLSLPGVGKLVGATMLAEASQPLADRDYHRLRCYAGTAPVTRQSGKRKTVVMRRGCNNRLRDALYHWARVSIQKDPCSREHYNALRQSGHGYTRALRGIADRWLAVLIAMLKSGTLYDAGVRGRTQRELAVRRDFVSESGAAVAAPCHSGA
jgi:transposase